MKDDLKEIGVGDYRCRLQIATNLIMENLIHFRFTIILFLFLCKCKNNDSNRKINNLSENYIQSPINLDKLDSCSYYTKGYFKVGSLKISNFYLIEDSMYLDLNYDTEIDTIILLHAFSKVRSDKAHFCLTNSQDFSKIVFLSKSIKKPIIKEIEHDGFGYFELENINEKLSLSFAANGVNSFYCNTFMSINLDNYIKVDSIVLSNSMNRIEKIVPKDENLYNLTPDFIDSFRRIKNI